MSDDSKKSAAKSKKIWQAGLDVLIESTPLIGPSAAAMMRAARDGEAAEDGSLDDLAEETRRQTLELRMAEMQAQVAQEIAIAQRIQNADEVEIEEYYEGEAEGNVGVKTDPQGLSIGVGGKGRKVTKRVFRFKGSRTT